MFLIRKLVLILLKNNIVFKAKHIAGTQNSIADALSRKQFKTFQELAPQANKIPEKIPVEFQQLMLEMK